MHKTKLACSPGTLYTHFPCHSQGCLVTFVSLLHLYHLYRTSEVTVFLMLVIISSVTQSCQTLCGPISRRKPGLPVHHQLLEFIQTHIHWVGDAIQPSHPSSVIPFSSCPQSFPASGSFQTSQLFASGGQSIGVSASTSVLPTNAQDWSPLGWTCWISLQSKRLWYILPISKSFPLIS